MSDAKDNRFYREPASAGLFVECSTCGGSGFSGRGTGYDDVCSECGGVKFVPAALGTQADNFTPGPPVEIREKNGAIDEIVIRKGSVHIEQMSADGWFMGVNASDGSYWQFWFGAKNRKSAVEFRHTEMVPDNEFRPGVRAVTRNPRDGE